MNWNEVQDYVYEANLKEDTKYQNGERLKINWDKQHEEDEVFKDILSIEDNIDIVEVLKRISPSFEVGLQALAKYEDNEITYDELKECYRAMKITSINEKNVLKGTFQMVVAALAKNVIRTTEVREVHIKPKPPRAEPKYTKSDVAIVKRLKSKGYSYREIMEETKINSRTTIARMLKGEYKPKNDL